MTGCDLALQAVLTIQTWLAALGTLAGLGGVAFSLSHPELGPLWYSILIVVTALPCLAAGAWLRVRAKGGP